MSRQISAGSFKKGYQLRSEPTPGTALRAVYDELFEFAGRWHRINSIPLQQAGAMYQKLCDDYGLDIRKGYNRGWLLAGEYVDGGYLDYVANPELARKHSI